MRRRYRLSRGPTDEMKEEIQGDIAGDLQEVEAQFSEDGAFLTVKTEEHRYPEVMTRILNICCRVGNNCELFFAGFVE